MYNRIFMYNPTLTVNRQNSTQLLGTKKRYFTYLLTLVTVGNENEHSVLYALFAFSVKNERKVRKMCSFPELLNRCR